MSFKEEVYKVVHWHSQTLEFYTEKDFMDYLKKFVTEYFKEFATFNTNTFKIKIEEYQLMISILEYKFIAKIESPYIVFYKRQGYNQPIKIGSYRNIGPQTIFDMTVKNFHPEYLEMLIEDTFSDIRNIHSKIAQKQYWL